MESRSSGELSMARKAVKEILSKHGLKTDVLLCDFFMEVGADGKYKHPAIVGATNQAIVLAVRADPPSNFQSHSRLLAYHVLGLDSVHLSVCCVHYKKFTVRTSYDHVRHLIIDDESDLWERWVETVRWHRSRIQIRGSHIIDYGVKGTIAIRINIPDKRLTINKHQSSEAEGNTFPFDPNFFLKLMNREVNPIEETALAPLDVDHMVPVQADALGRFLERRHWGEEFPTQVYSPHRLPYYERDTTDEADNVSILSWDPQLEEALRVLGD